MIWRFAVVIFLQTLVLSAQNGKVPGELVLVPEEQLLYVTPEMEAFLDKWVDPADRETQRLDALIDAILIMEEGLRFQYSGNETFTAREAFEKGRGNCLSFALLVAALGRKAGLTIHFNRVETIPDWDTIGEILVRLLHTNLIVEVGARRYVIEPRPDQPELTYLDIDLLSDKQVFAEFYNNLGVYALSRRENELALAYLNRAVTIDPACTEAWRNKALFYRIRGETDKALELFELSLANSPKDPLTCHLMSELLKDMGKEEESRRYARFSEKYMRSNPFYHYGLGKKALENEDFLAAIRHFKKAIKLKKDFYHFYYCAGAAYYRIGQDSKARTMLQKAVKLAPDDDARDRCTKLLENPDAF